MWKRDAYRHEARQGLGKTQNVYVVADGRVWIWNTMQRDRFQEATGVLDFYHASQHLWTVRGERSTPTMSHMRALRWAAVIELSYGMGRKTASCKP